MTLALFILFLLFASLLTLTSYVERVYSEMGKFLSRTFEENISFFELQVEPLLGARRDRASLSMSVLAQLSTAAIALQLGYSTFRSSDWRWSDIAEVAVAVVLTIIIFNRLIPFVLFTRTHGKWVKSLASLLRILIYLAMPVTVLLGFCLSVAALADTEPDQEPETSAEAVDALIEAGQEEGILEESDRALIQSVVEFGDKTVREVMTPRPQIVALPSNALIETFTELVRDRPFSRVPIYEGSIDQVKGIVLTHDVLQVSDSDARTRTVGDLMRPAWFVPETKRVTELMREMQRENQNMALVVDEYGGIAGVVTMEDLVEEIVGEIGDEHEATSDVIRENEHSYIVSGNMDVDRLDRLLGVRPESYEATTVSGLVSELIGRIPTAGEVFEENGLRFEVLDSTDRRIERLRVSTAAR